MNIRGSERVMKLHHLHFPGRMRLSELRSCTENPFRKPPGKVSIVNSFKRWFLVVTSRGGMNKENR